MAIHASTTSWKAVERTKLDIYVFIDYNCDKSVYIKLSVHNALLELPSSGKLLELPSSGTLLELPSSGTLLELPSSGTLLELTSSGTLTIEMLERQTI